MKRQNLIVLTWKMYTGINMEDTAWERLAEERDMSKIGWNKAPFDAQFYSAFAFRKHIDGEEYEWNDGFWYETSYEHIESHKRDYHDFEMRPDLVIERLRDQNKQPTTTPERIYDKSSIDFLEEVKGIQSQRASEYEQDGGERSFAKVATVFNTYTAMQLQPSHVALILEILKNVRFYSQDGYHSDSVVDKISYASLWAELVTKERT